jgi:hypothetical protein
MISTEPTRHPAAPSADSEQTSSAISFAIDKWYASHSAVRRMWVIDEAQCFRIIVALEPTLDGDETRPIWLANSRTWIHELQLLVNRIVKLELIDDSASMELAADVESLLVADILWRDPGEPAAG